MKNTNKIHPLRLKEIKTIADELPIIYRTDETGEIKMKEVVHRLRWKYLTTEQKTELVRKGENAKREDKFKHGKYTITKLIPIQVNHLDELKKAYQRNQEQGVIDYVEAVNAITVEGKRKQAEAANKAIEEVADKTMFDAFGSDKETKTLQLKNENNV